MGYMRCQLTVSATFFRARVAAVRVDLPAGAKLSVDCVCLLAEAFDAAAFLAGAFAGAFLLD